MTLLLDRPQTSSSAVSAEPAEGVVTGLLVDAVFGTSAGVAIRSLKSDVYGITTVPASDDDTMAVGVADQVRALRDAICSVGISRQTLGRLLGVNRRSLSGWASGEIRPSPERIATLRSLARTTAEIDAEYTGRAVDILDAPRGTTTFIEALAAGRTRPELWRSWRARAAAPVTVVPRRRLAKPIAGAAARALADGRLREPTWERTPRPESTYEMRPDEEAGAFPSPNTREREWPPRLPMIPAERFYVEAVGPPRQGDILLAGVTRLVAEDRFSPAGWDQLDAYDVTVSGARDDNDMWLEAGPSLVMVTSHDCHFDKEWNI
jgi:transcriptional regulator with XRE-family HTH domain